MSVSYTQDPDHPNPAHFPVCGTCGTPYILRLSVILRFNSKNRRDNGSYQQWLFQRDCKHKKATVKRGQLTKVDLKRAAAQAASER